MVSRLPPSFFKMLLDPSAHHLPLPSDFVCMHLKNKIPKGPIVLQCANGCHLWRLKMEKIGESYCFTHGWNNVVEDKHLGFGDFLVIWSVNRSTFKMLVYSPNGCEKIMPYQQQHFVPPKELVVDHHVDDDGNNGNSDDGGDVDGDNGGDGDPSFASIMSKTHEKKLRLPAHFNGLPGIDEREGCIIVKNPKGKEWPMSVRLDRSFQSERYLLSTGWPKFFRSNNLSLGDKCVFKFIRSQGKILLAKVTKTKRLMKLTNESETSITSGDADVETSSDADVAEDEEDYVKVVKRPRLTPHHDSDFFYF